MQSESTAKTPLRQIPRELILELNSVAERSKALGVELFLFGSLAETFPQYRRGADLDLGFRVKSGDKNRAVRRIRKLVEGLPTVRPVDLVDFDEVSVEFERAASTSRFDFPLPVT